MTKERALIAVFWSLRASLFNQLCSIDVLWDRLQRTAIARDWVAWADTKTLFSIRLEEVFGLRSMGNRSAAWDARFTMQISCCLAWNSFGKELPSIELASAELEAFIFPPERHSESTCTAFACRDTANGREFLWKQLSAAFSPDYRRCCCINCRKPQMM